MIKLYPMESFSRILAYFIFMMKLSDSQIFYMDLQGNAGNYFLPFHGEWRKEYIIGRHRNKYILIILSAKEVNVE